MSHDPLTTEVLAGIPSLRGSNEPTEEASDG